LKGGAVFYITFVHRVSIVVTNETNQNEEEK